MSTCEEEHDFEKYQSAQADLTKPFLNRLETEIQIEILSKVWQDTKENDYKGMLLYENIETMKSIVIIDEQKLRNFRERIHQNEPNLQRLHPREKSIIEAKNAVRIQELEEELHLAQKWLENIQEEYKNQTIHRHEMMDSRKFVETRRNALRFFKAIISQTGEQGQINPYL